jgi:hypothetical protein
MVMNTWNGLLMRTKRSSISDFHFSPILSRVARL